MTEAKIQNHRQARTAEQYLHILNEEMLDDDITLEEIQHKQSQIEEILLELERFHRSRAIRLVVDNTKEGDV